MCSSPKDVLIAHLEDMVQTKEKVTRELCKLIAAQDQEINRLKAEIVRANSK